MIFKIYNCEFGFKISGVKYTFDHVTELQIEDNEKNHITRGANASNKVGLSYKDGLKDPKKWTIPILNMSAALKGVLDSAFDNQTRLDVFAVDKGDGSAKMAKNAILCNKPQQLMLDDSADSMKVSLEFETFDSAEDHKS